VNIRTSPPATHQNKPTCDECGGSKIVGRKTVVTEKDKWTNEPVPCPACRRENLSWKGAQEAVKKAQKARSEKPEEPKEQDEPTAKETATMLREHVEGILNQTGNSVKDCCWVCEHKGQLTRERLIPGPGSRYWCEVASCSIVDYYDVCKKDFQLKEGLSDG
jgi:hypothetical protein